MIPEAKMQSVGQAGPQVNRDLEVLFDKLNEVIRGFNGLETTVLSVTKGGTGGVTTGGGGNTGGSSPFDGTFTYETPVVLAQDGAGTEDAWTTVASGAPAGTRYALIQFYLFSDTDDVDSSISWRTENGSAEIRACEIDSDEDDAEGQTHQPWFIVPLTDSGDFDYLVTTTAGTSQWEIRRIGYVA